VSVDVKAHGGIGDRTVTIKHKETGVTLYTMKQTDSGSRVVNGSVSGHKVTATACTNTPGWQIQSYVQNASGLIAWYKEIGGTAVSVKMTTQFGGNSSTSTYDVYFFLKGGYQQTEDTAFTFITSDGSSGYHLAEMTSHTPAQVPVLCVRTGV
jgi:hypothetical protein